MRQLRDCGYTGRVLAASLLAIWSTGCQARELERSQSPAQADRAELIETAHSVAALVEAGQFEALEGFAATPLSLQPATIAFLKSVREVLLKRHGKLEILVEWNIGDASVLFNDGRVARLYFYDPSHMKLSLPLQRGQGQYWMTRFVTCLFVKTGSGWRIYKTPFESESDGPMTSGADPE